MSRSASNGKKTQVLPPAARFRRCDGDLMRPVVVRSNGLLGRIGYWRFARSRPQLEWQLGNVMSIASGHGVSG